MRVKYMRVAAQFYADLCKGLDTNRVRAVAHTLPSDARVVDAKVTDSGWLMLVIYSDSFEDLPTDSVMPEHPATQFEIVTSRSAPRVPKALPTSTPKDDVH